MARTLYKRAPNGQRILDDATVRWIRDTLDESQEAFAVRLGVRSMTVIRLERGETKKPHWKTLRGLSAAFREAMEIAGE